MSLDLTLYFEVDVGKDDKEWHTVFDANITHNLTEMADKAGIYELIWHPDRIGITKAEEIVDPLIEGIHKMETDPIGFKKLNPENGWGSYDDFLPWLRDYLNACGEYSEAKIHT